MRFPVVCLQRSPDPETPIPPIAGNDDGAPDRGLPEDVDDLVYQAGKVATRWLTEPDIMMVDITTDGFVSQVNQLKTAVLARKQAGGGRSVFTNKLKTLDEDIDTATAKVKAYLVGKYEDEEVATAHYGTMGIVHEGANYRLPKDRQDRLPALELMITGIASEGFGAKQYGTAFWTQMRTDYMAALSGASGTDGTVSGDVADIAPLEEAVRYILTGLRYILRGNYQKTYRQIWREWGFQAEDN